MAIPAERFFAAAFEDYHRSLCELIAQYDAPGILELGGGRTPSFKLSDLPGNVASYTVNDISADELALASDEYEKACFDVVGDVSEFAGKYDVIFSRTLIEHVSDGIKMHENVLALLKPGGVAFHMAPTLYSPPFVLNKLLPEKLSREIVFFFFPRRRNDEPKFPAHYSWCYGNRAKMEGMLKRVGYSKASLRSFYGHGYFEKLPILRSIDAWASALAESKDWSSFGSYAHITAFK